jgi:hypothetical protein
MSLPGLQRLVSASESDIIEIINTINYNLQSIPNYIKVCVEQFGYFDMQPYKIDADVSLSGAYINLYFPSGHHLVFVCHQTDRDSRGLPRPNRMHCKVYMPGADERQPSQGYSGVLFDGKSFLFKDYMDPRFELINIFRQYFFCIFNAINEYRGKQNGGVKNIKNNLKTNTVLELKNICKNYKIKNYSKLNKDGLISLIKKTKKNLNK